MIGTVPAEVLEVTVQAKSITAPSSNKTSSSMMILAVMDVTRWKAPVIEVYSLAALIKCSSALIHP
jgi:hypothetical protein